MIRLFSLLAASILLLLLISAMAAGVQELSPSDAAKAMSESPGLIILDVRTPNEFSQGRIKGAVNIDFYAKDFTEQLDKLDKDEPYLVYCRSGRRSGVTTEAMVKLGFTDIRHLIGGIQAWNKAGLPLEQ